MFRLDYISCILTIGSTILVGKKRWEGWIVAGFNSVLICIIAVNTAQLGFIPANLFCLALYTYNISQWRKGISKQTEHDQRNTVTQSLTVPRAHQIQS